MSFNALLRTLGCAGLLVAMASPSYASDTSDAFAANIRLKASFLVQASDLAKDRAGSDKIRQFAAGQKVEQVGVLDDLDGLPAPVAQTFIAELSQPATGRSVARDPVIDLDTIEAPAGVGALMPAATIGLDRLSSLKGEAFDALYASVARGVISDMAAFYQAYSKTGDDTALRALAVRELPRTTTDLTALN